MSLPLTHEEYAKDCAEAYRKGQRLQQRVQVRYGAATVCGVIRDAYDTPEGRPMWKVELTGIGKGVMSFPTHLVRKCSGVDERCTCGEKNGSC